MLIKNKLNLNFSKSVKCHDNIKTFSLCTGSGMSLIHNVQTDCFLTGDVKYHDAMQAKSINLSLIDIGHYESEHFFAQILDKHLKIQQKLDSPSLPVSSDIIESLFGKFKHTIEKSPQSDMNHSILVIPLLCGKMSEEKISNALNSVSQKELEKWKKDNIGETMRSKRINFFKKNTNTTSPVQTEQKKKNPNSPKNC